MSANKLIPGVNDLATLKPDLAKEWDYERNGDVVPQKIALHSNKQFYWICPKGHPSYLAIVSHRSERGNGCPVCSNHQIIKGINDFETHHPELMDEWLWEENDKNDLIPSKIGPCSSSSAVWKCRICGGIWNALISNRVRLHSGCQYCANLKFKKSYNDLLTLSPIISEEWDYEKNTPLTPDSIVATSTKKVWWKCNKCGNSWHISPLSRKKSGCPYCSSHAIIKGFNDFESSCPELIKEWDYEKNGNLLPSQLAKGSERKIWWKCKNSHSWQATLNSRVGGNGCPYCSNKKILVGYNDLFTTHPSLKDEWDFKKNSISPLSITAGSNKKAWWICQKCNFSWNANISSRAKSGHGCPECGKEKNRIERLKTIANNNPLFEKYPKLAKEWDYEKNKNLDTTLIPASSNRLVWWKCEEGHSFKTRIVSRTLKNVGCPYCHGQKVLTGINDLQTLNPSLASEWDYEKNAPLAPSDVFSHGSKFVWWKCSICGNSWKAKINNRANARGCPDCNSKGTSFIEQALFYYIKKDFQDAQNRYLYNGFELDIFIPSLKTALEYDGVYYHSKDLSKQREAKKDSFCKQNGIQLIRLREKPLNYTDNAINISCDCSTWNLLEETCASVINRLNPDIQPDISIKRDYREIVEQKKSLIKGNSFGKTFPLLLKEWDYQKNGKLTPELFSAGSDVKVWWVCDLGHSWQSVIANRCRIGTGCPICSRKKVLSGYNDLKTTNPTIANEWDYEKNGELKPDMVVAGSNKKVWWLCSVGHSYYKQICSRTAKNNSGCPYCSRSQVLVGFNDLKTTDSELINEWDFKKNGDLKPEMVIANSGKSVWWICQHGHSYKAAISQKKNGYNCPYCTRTKVLVGYNDLLTTHPYVADKWDYEKNGILRPEMFVSGSNKIVWWKCDICGNEWKDSILKITDAEYQMRGCRKCADIRHPFQKRIKSIDTNGNETIYVTIKEAGKKLLERGYTKSKVATVHISDCLRGTRKSAYGFKWQYVDEEQ